MKINVLTNLILLRAEMIRNPMLFLFLKEARASVDALCLSKKKSPNRSVETYFKQNRLDISYLELFGNAKNEKNVMFVHFLSALKTKYLLIKIFFSFQSLSCFYQNLSSPRKSLVTFWEHIYVENMFSLHKITSEY